MGFAVRNARLRVAVRAGVRRRVCELARCLSAPNQRSRSKSCRETRVHCAWSSLMHDAVADASVDDWIAHQVSPPFCTATISAVSAALANGG